MALVRDPNWTGPGPGPLIDDGMGAPSPDYTALANQAAGLSGDTATADYIRNLASGSLGGEADTRAAFGRLIEEGRLREVAAAKANTVSSGTTTDSGSNSGSNSGAGALPTSSAAANELRAVLRRYGLDGLFDDLNAAVIADSSLVKNTDALFGAVRANPIYVARFKGNIQRAKNGLVELSEAEYISQEQAYATTLKALGMPRGFYDTQDDYAKFIANDISPVELNNRIQQGYNATKNAPPEVLTQLKMLVPGLQDADLAAYFLDPTRSGQEIERKARAAQIAAQGKVAGGMQLTATQAESLATQGVTADTAQQGFTQIGQAAGLYRPLQGEEAITQEDILAGVFTNEQAAQQRIAMRKRRRQAEFEQGGGFVAQQNKNIGLTTVGE